jgi:hypothetical protein
VVEETTEGEKKKRRLVRLDFKGVNAEQPAEPAGVK